MTSSRFISLLLILQLLSTKYLVICYEEDFHSHELNINIEFLRKIFSNLIQENPIVLLLDDEETYLEPAIRPILTELNSAGSVIYTYTSSLKDKEIKSRKRGSPTLQVSFRWTYICLIEEKRSKLNTINYLNVLSAVGHARNDQYLLVGLNSYLTHFVRVPVTKFKNIIAVTISSAPQENIVYQRLIGSKRLDRLTSNEVETVRWHEIGSMIGLSGHHFRISGTKFPPYLDVFDDNSPSPDPVKFMGVNYQIFYQGSKAYNFTFTFNPQNEWKLTGKRFPNGSWDGVFADLLNGKVDIASVSTQTAERNSLADFVGPFGRTHLVFATAPPRNLLGKYAIFRSYTVDVWLVILLYYIVIVGLTFQALRNSNIIESFNHSPKRKGKEEILKTLSNAWLISWGISFEQTVERKPIGTKVVIMLWVFFVLVIGTGYRSNLAAKISFPQAEFRPKTFRELARATDFKIYFDLNGLDAWTYFEESTSQMIQKLKARAITVDNTSHCVVLSLMEPKSVCIGWDFTLKIAISKTMTVSQLRFPLYRAKEAVWSAWYTFALSKNSRFTQAFQTVGQHFFEAGLNSFYRFRLINTYRDGGRNWTYHNQNTTQYKKLMEITRESGQSEKKPFKVANFQLIFLIWLIGLLLSSARFLWEILSVGNWSLSERRKLHRISIISSSDEHDHDGQIFFQAKSKRKISVDFVR